MLDHVRSLYPKESEEFALLAQIDEKRLPRHVAIIMDGNGRWAKQKNLAENSRAQRRRGNRPGHHRNGRPLGHQIL